MFESISERNKTISTIPENQAYQEMLKPARERLRNRSPQDIAQKAGVKFNEKSSCFQLESLGQPIHIDYPKCNAVFSRTGEPFNEEWWHLIILHYLDMADGTPLDSNLIPFGELPGGLIRGSRFDRQSAEEVAAKFGSQKEEKVIKACESLGAETVKSNADLCAVIPFLPRYPITLKIWFADDELEGSGRLFLNGQAAHYLSVEDAVTAGSIVLEALTASV